MAVYYYWAMAVHHFRATSEISKTSQISKIFSSTPFSQKYPMVGHHFRAMALYYY